MNKFNQFILFIAQLLLILALMSSCITFKKCVDKYGSMEPVKVIAGDSVDFETPVAHDSLRGTIPCPQLPVASDQPVTGNRQPATDTTIERSGRAQIKYWYDQYQKAIRYQVDCLPDTIRDTKYVEIEADCPQVAVLDPEKGQPRHRALWLGFQRVAAWLVLLEILLVFIYLKFIHKKSTHLYVEKDDSLDNK